MQEVEPKFRRLKGTGISRIELAYDSIEYFPFSKPGDRPNGMRCSPSTCCPRRSQLQPNQSSRNFRLATCRIYALLPFTINNCRSKFRRVAVQQSLESYLTCAALSLPTHNGR